MKPVAEKKKSQNIPEYIIYMYQMEDLIRAYEFNLDEIKQFVVSHYPISDEEKEETLNWFSELAEQMKKEGIAEKGHLSKTQIHVAELATIHWSLIKTDKTYFEHYKNAKPHIVHLVIEAGEEAPSNEIQVCLNAVYGLLLAKLKGREIPKDMNEATDAFGNVLSYLNWIYFYNQEKSVREN
ncbi:DUF4924 family protein [Mongoliibacter ruber]|uniref:Uncharacterized protein DUF4924 n=1 Tax=Mongoliibacter ruber TaxID=1750599 RepID=A0A2T0WEZ0_9BACT|nr:DUF4924 family protein [Mongoliibacter ruber]PRY85278.1 uncharacterized protein DUF4924 [Mongoliibacter ruber]